MTKQTFHVRVSPKGFAMSLVDKAPKPGYTVQADSATRAFDLVKAFRDGATWATQAAANGDLQVHDK